MNLCLPNLQQLQILTTIQSRLSYEQENAIIFLSTNYDVRLTAKQFQTADL